MDPVIAYGQLIANLSALVVIGWIYAAYVKNLRAGLGLKDEQLATIRANLELWKDKDRATDFQYLQKAGRASLPESSMNCRSLLQMSSALQRRAHSCFARHRTRSPAGPYDRAVHRTDKGSSLPMRNST